MNPRVVWADLPATLRARIEAEAGPFAREQQVAAGHNCLIGMVLHTDSGVVFLKGVPADHARAVWTQANEATINRHVRGVAPALRFHIQDAGWDVLGFDYLAGYRHADFSPGSPDLAKIAVTLDVLAGRQPPADVKLRTIEDRWSDYTDGRGHLLAGPAITHTDLHRQNIMIDDRAMLIDWAWPTLAAAWIDRACVGLQLIQAGHHPQDAENWCRRSTAYAKAAPEAISTFVTAARGLWTEISAADPEPWKRELAVAADTWAAHRGLG